MKLTMILVVFGVVAFLVGTLTVPELGEANPRVKILAAISVAKTHRDALDKTCTQGLLKAGMPPGDLGLEAPDAYAGNFRSGVDVAVVSPAQALVTVRLKSIGKAVPADANVRYTGDCADGVMRWSRSTSPADLLPPKHGPKSKS